MMIQMKMIQMMVMNHGNVRNASYGNRPIDLLINAYGALVLIHLS